MSSNVEGVRSIVCACWVNICLLIDENLCFFEIAQRLHTTEISVRTFCCTQHRSIALCCANKHRVKHTTDTFVVQSTDVLDLRVCRDDICVVLSIGNSGLTLYCVKLLSRDRMSTDFSFFDPCSERLDIYWICFGNLQRSAFYWYKNSLSPNCLPTSRLRGSPVPLD